MVGSRHLQGTIISRVRTLLKSGALNKPPLWYSVVSRFPPPSSSVLLTKAEPKDLREIPKITYPEDEAKRVLFTSHKKAFRDPTSLFPDLENPVETKVDLFLKEYHKFVEEGHTHEMAITNAVVVLKTYLAGLRGAAKNTKFYAPQSTSEQISEVIESNADDPNELFDIMESLQASNEDS